MSAMSLPKDEAWFPAKRYGWGWGLPTRWQGWVTLSSYLGVLAGSSYLLDVQSPLFLSVVASSSLVFTSLCYLKGEKPSWSWGARRS